MYFILLFGISLLSAIPANMAAIGAAWANFPIPRKKNRIDIISRKSVSIDRNLNFALLFLIFIRRMVVANNINKEIIVIVILNPEELFVPTMILTKIRSIISTISSRVPIPIILCPNFVFMILNSSSIGINIASPTVEKDNATIEEINQE